MDKKEELNLILVFFETTLRCSDYENKKGADKNTDASKLLRDNYFHKS